MVDRKLFTEKIEQYIKDNGKTQAEIGRLLGIEDPTTFHKWVKCKNLMPSPVIYQFCTLLGRTVSERDELLVLAGYVIPEEVASVTPKVPSLVATDELDIDEQQIMELLLQYITTPEIAKRMGKSDDTIKQMLTGPIYSKLNAKNLSSAKQSYRKKYLFRWKILEYVPIIMLVVYVSLFILVFLPIWLRSARETDWNYYSNIYLVLPLSYGLFGYARLIQQYQKPKYFSIALSIIYLALIIWSIGNINWMVHNFRYGENLPYPSLGDWAYLTSNALLIMGLCLLQTDLGVMLRPKLQKIMIRGSILLVVLIFTMVLTRSLALGHWHEKDDWKLFFDVVLPFTSGFACYCAIVWRKDPSFSKLEAEQKKAFSYIFSGLVFLAIADFSFSITTTLPDHSRFAYYNGCLIDFFFTTAFFLFGRGLLTLPVDLIDMKNGNHLEAWVRLGLAHVHKLTDLLFGLQSSKHKAPKFYIFF